MDIRLVPPHGYISGMIAGNIICSELRDASLECYGVNYNTLFSLVRTQVPKIDNGMSGKAKRYYYREADVRELVQTMIKGMREIFEERK